ncbi:hypothetical protein ABH14_00310 [Brevibacillus brevis]|uniref:hypothetical protein n=1 Tax=Brevibacillus brevis TaxID=1393 RepID=UPI001900D85E|nr:hypothetical protein [Brevibacillus brevis]MBH0328257.1 hypothetical protein [Brevibacillus brevis]
MSRIAGMKSSLPYALRRYENEASELVNRRYRVIARKGPVPEGNFRFETFYYDDSNPPWKNQETYKKCKAVLNRWR